MSNSHLEPLELALFEDIESALSTSNEMAEDFGYSVGDEITAEHYTEDGQIDARFRVIITLQRIEAAK